MTLRIWLHILFCIFHSVFALYALKECIWIILTYFTLLRDVNRLPPPPTHAPAELHEKYWNLKQNISKIKWYSHFAVMFFFLIANSLLAHFNWYAWHKFQE